MATTTPNYGWPVPTSSDLVKNGATDIEALGDAADATMATMVPKSIVDAKGDIIAATAADTVSRLAVGANNTVLTADSSAATGLKWAAAAGGGKVLQVVNATTSTQTDSSSATYADTTLTATITPTSNTSKVLVFVSQNGLYKNNDAPYGGIKLLRGATLLVQMDTYSTISGAGVSQLNVSSTSTTYLDSPATTSATTYKTQSNNGAASSVFRVQHGATSTITLMEIGA
jgi:hypothetical protein